MSPEDRQPRQDLARQILNGDRRTAARLLSRQDLARQILNGDRRTAARLLSRAEAGDQDVVPALSALHARGGAARIIGFTGPPGAGKSTLVDRVVSQFRARGNRVAVLAVDPSSPFSGGAVLGDRIRMSQHAEDSGVLIRSMAARGALGGLAPATGDAMVILDALGFDVILIETVGVGQSEIDILAHADAIVLLQTAHGGDGVQMVKAGVLEIADVLVVNKADTPGSDRMVRGLREMAAHGVQRLDGWTPPVLTTEAVCGLGVDDLMTAIDSFFSHRAAHPAADRERRRRQVKARVLAIAEEALRRRLSRRDDAELEAWLDMVIARTRSPHDLAAALTAEAS